MLVGAQTVELFLAFLKLGIAGVTIYSGCKAVVSEMEWAERRKRLVRVLACFIMFLFVVAYEASYRPKMQGAQGQSRIDAQPIAPLRLPAALGDKEDNANNGYSQKNVQENRDAVKAFRELK